MEVILVKQVIYTGNVGNAGNVSNAGRVSNVRIPCNEVLQFVEMLIVLQ